MATPTVNSSASAIATGGTTSVSVSITGSGSNRAIFAGACNDATTPQAMSATYNSNTMTEMWDFTASYEGNAGYYYLNPDTVSRTVQVTVASSVDDLFVGAVSLADVDQTTPVGTSSTANGFGSLPSVTVATAADDLVLDIVNNDGKNSMSVGSGQSTTFPARSGSFTAAAGSSEAATGTSVTMSWSMFSTANWMIGAVGFKGATGGGGPTVIPQRTLMGVGV